jgi:hypothetical protein
MTDTTAEGKRWLTEGELRAHLGYSRATLARFRARGLPHVGRARLRRYSLAEVLDWLKADKEREGR